jgi:hypothetical protein
MTTAIDTATDTSPDTHPFTEAVLITCALAIAGNPLSGLGVDAEAIRRIHTRARAEHTDTQLPRWRDHVDSSLWDLTWGWARQTTRRCFPDAEGIKTIPADYTDLPAELTPLPA